MRSLRPTSRYWSLFGLLLLMGGAALYFAPAATWAQDEPLAETAAESTPDATADPEPATTPVVEEEEAGEAAAAEAEEEAAAPPPASEADDFGYTINTLIMFLCGVLVLFMQAGFAMVEVGLNAAKNTVNILFKNIMDISVGVLLFFVVGYGLMYPGDGGNGWFAFGGTGISARTDAPSVENWSPDADFLFQVAFAATAATIVSGAVAGRMKFEAYLVYSAFLTALIYPISGYWKWGGGWTMTAWLNEAGEGPQFQDFAGSAVVHAVGGFAGLAGAIVLGPRLGRFVKGKSMPIPGHNLAFAALGVFILWVGWYGFNPGSQLTYAGYAGADATAYIAVTTTLSAAAGVVFALMLGWILFKKPDLTLALNGALGGLVGITANCDAMGYGMAIVVGAVSGIVVVLGILLLDKLKIDDPVGAFPVHGLCGVWGCLALGILPNAHLASGATNLWVQAVSTAAICGWAFVTLFGLFFVLKMIGMLRVSPEEEQDGLDMSEHGMHAYPSHLVVDHYGGSPSSAPRPEPVGAR